VSRHVLVDEVGGQEEEERRGTLVSMRRSRAGSLGYGAHVYLYGRWATAVARRWSCRRDCLGHRRDICLFRTAGGCLSRFDFQILTRLSEMHTRLGRINAELGWLGAWADLVDWRLAWYVG
jgi:hypothetical protein